jgi:Rad52/22 family double-strand break repair protein
MTQMYGTLNRDQVQRLLVPPRGAILKKVDGATYIPHHEVRAALIRIFGPGRFDTQTEHAELVYETEEPNPNKQNATRWRVCYRVGVRLRIRDFDGDPVAEYVEWHTDESIHPSRAEAHANAITSAQSVALRRAAINLGDAMGLCLYDDGRTTPLVRGTLMYDLIPQQAKPAVTDEQKQALETTLGARAEDTELPATPEPDSREAPVAP